MDIGKQTGDAVSDHLHAFQSMTQMLGAQHAIFGPNPDDIKELVKLKKDIALANTQANGLKAFIVGSSSEFASALGDLVPDAPELLQLNAGMIYRLNKTLRENARVICSKPFTSAEIKQINRDIDTLNNILVKACDALMELRQKILNERGLAPHFRATRYNLEKIAAEANRADLGEQDFVEI